jgi:tetratricopeptide (TPR) repeat protein
VFHLRLGDLGAAISVLERDVQLCRTAEILTVSAWVAPCLGLAYALSGRALDAVPLLEQAAEQGTKATGDHAWQIGVTAEGYLTAGRVDEAARLADRSLRLAREGKERGYEAWALRLLGEIASDRDVLHIENAEAHYRQASALASELGMRPLVAHCHLGLGKLYRHTGQRAGSGAPHHRDDAVSRDGHAVLAGAGRGRDAGVGMRTTALAILGLSILVVALTA